MRGNRQILLVLFGVLISFVCALSTPSSASVCSGSVSVDEKVEPMDDRQSLAQVDGYLFTSDFAVLDHQPVMIGIRQVTVSD